MVLLIHYYTYTSVWNVFCPATAEIFTDDWVVSSSKNIPNTYLNDYQLIEMDQKPSDSD